VGTLVALALLRDAEETRAWRRRLLTFRANWRWYVLAALLPAFAWFAGTALTTIFGGHFPFHPLLLLVFPFLLLANTGEEVGWRGFALPRLLTRYNGLTASLIVGVLWSLFHLPLYLQTPLTFLPFLCLLTALSVLMTWVFNHTGSVPIMVVMHASLDTTTNFVAPPNETASTIAVFALSALVIWLIALIIILRTGPDLGRASKVDILTPAVALPAQLEA
jgi:membrane protease YdiL (CAAX protease family)